MTVFITIGFLFTGGLIVAAFVWGFSLVGEIMIPVAILLAIVIALAWAAAGWLLK